MKKAGIHMRLTLAAFVLICFATFTLDVVGVHITKRFMLKRFRDRVAFLAKYLALNSEVGVLIGDRAGLKILALNLLGEEDVAKVIITDNRNNSLVSLEKKVPPPLSVVETPVLFKKARDENVIFGSGRYNPFVNTHEKTTEHIGKVKIYFSTHTISQLMNEITGQFIWFSLGLVFMAGLVFYFLSRSIVVEVKQLVETAGKVGKGNMDIRAPLGKLPETAELASAFNTMLDSLQESQKALAKVSQEMIRQKSLAEMGKFSLMIAHEVKNPLGIIKSSLDILKKDLSLSSENMMVEYMEDEIQRLNKLIEDFLSFARPADPTFRDVELNEMLKSVIERFEIQYMESPLEFETFIPPKPFFIPADKDLLSRCVSNILKNACEANGEKGKIRIVVSCHADRWILEVKDQGKGISPDEADKIFDPFFTTKSRGTGLGLAFAAQVVKAHGGKISAENQDNGGAVFKVELARPGVIENGIYSGS